MDLGTVRELGRQELTAHGFRAFGESTTMRTRERSPGAVTLLSLRGNSTELAIDTTAPHPDHVVFAFVEADAVWSRPQNAPWSPSESGFVIAAGGITRGVRCGGPWRAAIAFLPRSAMSPFVPELPTAAAIFTDRRLLDLAMQDFIEGLLNADEQPTAIERSAIDRLILEMGGAVLVDRAGGASAHGSPHAVLRDRAVAVISARCADANLTPTTVAREVQSSLRQLQLVFAEAGNSISGEIRRQRARVARSLLVDSRFDGLSVEQIARRSGFQSPMSLRRALDDAYRSTPRALRAQRSA